jgi:hypothetical protein
MSTDCDVDLLVVKNPDRTMYKAFTLHFIGYEEESTRRTSSMVRPMLVTETKFVLWTFQQSSNIFCLLEDLYIEMEST